jgi:mRNA interferase RelE/StbE
MAHSIKIERTARKRIASLEVGLQRRILQAIEGLAENPRPSGCKKLRGREEYRVRVGDYRVVYEVRDDLLIVLIVRVAHRGDAYK